MYCPVRTDAAPVPAASAGEVQHDAAFDRAGAHARDVLSRMQIVAFDVRDLQRPGQQLADPAMRPAQHPPPARQRLDDGALFVVGRLKDMIMLFNYY